MLLHQIIQRVELAYSRFDLLRLVRYGSCPKPNHCENANAEDRQGTPYCQIGYPPQVGNMTPYTGDRIGLVVGNKHTALHCGVMLSQQCNVTIQVRAYDR